jgi:hypothetical protein
MTAPTPSRVANLGDVLSSLRDTRPRGPMHTHANPRHHWRMSITRHAGRRSSLFLSFDTLSGPTELNAAAARGVTMMAIGGHQVCVSCTHRSTAVPRLPRPFVSDLAALATGSCFASFGRSIASHQEIDSLELPPSLENHPIQMALRTLDSLHPPCTRPFLRARGRGIFATSRSSPERGSVQLRPRADSGGQGWGWGG